MTLLLVLASPAGHGWLGWTADLDEQRTHGLPPDLSGYRAEMGRDPLENRQSEFLQRIWRVSGLAVLLHVGSPQPREEDERLEEKLDAVLRALSPESADRVIADLGARFDRT
ncbi:DUF6766 family protein [Rubellimicrobium aerolatum]|uniref:DUF6766 family protein n=1 Tax=Rubellimicrobium aerolatum TaxID=490979 RepID=A0ABW0SCL1_9RHOB|nr:DUF6766 family protein [Rubellimicrobium aerolatum]MBP1806141.1 hypothetical protein [Rubellimicrobium aerolatum]